MNLNILLISEQNWWYSHACYFNISIPLTLSSSSLSLASRIWKLRNTMWSAKERKRPCMRRDKDCRRRHPVAQALTARVLLRLPVRRNAEILRLVHRISGVYWHRGFTSPTALILPDNPFIRLWFPVSQ